MDQRLCPASAKNGATVLPSPAAPLLSAVRVTSVSRCRPSEEEIRKSYRHKTDIGIYEMPGEEKKNRRSWKYH